MKSLRLGFLLASLFLMSCANYLPIPWQDASGQADSARAAGARLAAGLAEGLRKSDFKNVSRFKARPDPSKEMETVLRIAVAGFPEARTGVRTAFSLQVEEAVRRALGASGQFRIVDGGEGVSWQEAKSFRPPIPAAQDQGDFDNPPEAVTIGDWRDEIGRAKLEGRADPPTPEELSAQLDGDHPHRGLWARARSGPYGEESAVYAASILGADAVVFGAYALGPGRVRVWAAVVLNAPPQAFYYVRYSRGLEDVFGLPERVERGRRYLAYVRDELPETMVPREALGERLEPNPRSAPAHPPYWGEPALDVRLEEIDAGGQRQSLAVRNTVGARSLVVGWLAAKSVRHVYAFSINRNGEAEEILSSADPGRQGWSRRVEPGQFFPFHARLTGRGQIYRLYFVSAPQPFEGEAAVQAARRRLGLGMAGPARVPRGVERAGPEAWFVAGGQERLVLERGWDQQVFWLFRRKGS